MEKMKSRKSATAGVIAFAVTMAFILCSFGLDQEDQSRQEIEIDQRISDLEHRHWEKAVEDLVKIGEPAVGPLLKALRGDNTWIAARSCYALAKIQTKEGVDALIAVLKNKEFNQRVRDYACLALGNVPSEEVITLLMELLREDGRALLRMFAARSLGEIGSDRAVDVLIKALKDESAYVRGNAAEALGKIHSEKGIMPLIEVLKDEKWFPRVHARDALLAIGKPAVEPLQGAIQDKDSHVRWQVALTLGRIKSEKAMEPLLKLIHDENWMVRNEAAVALAKTSSDRLIEALIKELNSGTCHVRQDAAWILGEMRPEKAIDPLIRSLKDGECGWMAAIALGKMQIEKASEPLKEAVSAFSGQMRRAAAWALRKIAPTIDPGQGKPEAAQGKELSTISYDRKVYPLYPKKMEALPEIPSPWTSKEGTEIVVSHTEDEKFMLVPVTLEGEEIPRKSKSFKGNQRIIDAEDFPALAQTGLHSGIELDMARTITGRSLAEITLLGRPGALSTSGFLAPHEDIISVIEADNHLVNRLGLTHPQLAKPLFHIFNLTEKNLLISNYLSFESHHAKYPPFMYNGKKIFVEIEYTKGGQESIFDDGITGALAITIRRDLDQGEIDFLDWKYAHLDEKQRTELKEKLSRLFTGEMVAFYIMRYGFYEGHTDWRADPLAIAFVFGLKSIEEIEEVFPKGIDKALTEHSKAKSSS